MAHKPSLRWMPLDNAAKIYPAARTKQWTNVFRLSATLTGPVDAAVLQSALDVTVKRFPSMAARLRGGVFWYYLQELEQAPNLHPEQSCPLTRMSREELRRCALRVICWENRIAVEFFHSLTDGNGGLVFLKTLLAEYLEQKYGLAVPAEQGVLDRRETPSPEELEDSFLKYDAPVNASRKESDAWRLTGTPVPDGFRHLTCFRFPVSQALNKAHGHGVSLTAFLAAALMEALLELQAEQVPNRRRRKPIKVLIPVNLRKLFPSKTLRNFAMYTIPEVDPKLGDYDFGELCSIVHHRMGLDVNPKRMGTMIATNVNSERYMAVRVMPLFLKNLVMKAVFDAVGERKSCLSLSNLGAVEVPAVMKPYIQRLDFILGVQATSPHNVGVVSWNGTVYVNFIRNIQESGLERKFFQSLQRQGVDVTVESNYSNE